VERLLDTKAVAAALGAPESTIRYWRWNGTGPAGFRLGRRVCYLESEVRRWVEAQRAAEAERRQAAVR